MTDPLTEAQSYQSVGELAPTAQDTLTHQHGWDGLATAPPPSVEPIDQLTSPSFSAWNNRTNRQGLGSSQGQGSQPTYAADFFAPVDSPSDIPPTAGYGRGSGAYDQTPTAAITPTSFPQASPGQIDGATAAADSSGNIGITDNPGR